MSSSELFDALWESRRSFTGPYIVCAGRGSALFDPSKYVSRSELQDNHDVPPLAISTSELLVHVLCRSYLRPLCCFLAVVVGCMSLPVVALSLFLLQVLLELVRRAIKISVKNMQEVPRGMLNNFAVLLTCFIAAHMLCMRQCVSSMRPRR